MSEKKKLILVNKNDTELTCILKHGAELLSMQGEKIYPLTLAYPENTSIAFYGEEISFAEVLYSPIGLKPINDSDALLASYDGHFLKISTDAKVLIVAMDDLNEGRDVAFMKSVIEVHNGVLGRGNDWIVNEDYSLSPRNAPDLVVGFLPEIELTAELLSEKLNVSVLECDVVQAFSTHSLGNSGCGYAKVRVRYGGGVDLPEMLFLKIRQHGKSVESFYPEIAIHQMTKDLELAVPKIVSADPDLLIMEDVSDQIRSENRKLFDVEDMKKLLNHYAKFHASLWNETDDEGKLLSQEKYDFIFSGRFVAGSEIAERQDPFLEKFCDPAQFEIMKQARDIIKGDINILLNYLNQKLSTVIQGDSHMQQILQLKNDDFLLIDFGTSTRANPVLDIGGIMFDLIPDLRLENDRELIEYYLTCLENYLESNNNPQTIDHNDFYEDYKIACFVRLLFLASFGLLTDDSPIHRAAGMARAHSHFFNESWLESMKMKFDQIDTK